MAPKIEDQIKTLTFKRDKIKSRLTRFVTFIEDPQNKTKFDEIEDRLANVKSCLKDFEDVHFSIELLDSEQATTEELTSFENEFYKVTNKAKALINNKPAISNQSSSSNLVNDPSLQVKLPNIHLPNFTGLFTEWLTFKDTFNSLIHDNDNLTNIQKFHYLKSSLKSVALQTIEHLTLSSDNYTAAWDLLQSRYENTRLITQHHIRAIFALPTVTEDAKSLRQLLHGLTSNIKALEAIKRPVGHWDDLLIHLITTKFDSQTTIAWENTLSNEPPTMKKMQSFLIQRCQMLESLEINTAYNKTSNSVTTQNFGKFNKYSNFQNSTSHVNINERSPACIMCKQQHKLYQCKTFLALSCNQRLVQVKKHNLCQNCLRAGHPAEKCLAGSCKTCHMKHNSLLHQSETVSPQKQVTPEDNSVLLTHCCNTNIQKEVLLSTAALYVKDKTNKLITCRALLDVGSQSNFITTNLCKKLGIQMQPVNISVSGVSTATSKIMHKTSITICSRINSYSSELECLVLDKITERLPGRTFLKSQIQIPSNIQLADPQFNISGEIDILLGAGIFWELLCDEKIHTGTNQPYFQKTQLGFRLGGNFGLRTNKLLTTCNLFVEHLDEQITKFWELENFEQDKPLSINEQLCELHLKKNVQRDSTGRFMVKLPFKENPPILGTSKQAAIKRFLSQENKFKRDRSLQTDYNNFIKEYESLNHLEHVPAAEVLNIPPNLSFYLPHHAVFKDSTTSKLRVVFDGSCQSSNAKA